MTRQFRLRADRGKKSLTDLQVLVRRAGDNRTPIRTNRTAQDTLIVCALQLLYFCQGRVRPKRHALIREPVRREDLFRVVRPDERGYLGRGR